MKLFGETLVGGRVGLDFFGLEEEMMDGGSLCVLYVPDRARFWVVWDSRLLGRSRSGIGGGLRRGRRHLGLISL